MEERYIRGFNQEVIRYLKDIRDILKEISSKSTNTEQP